MQKSYPLTIWSGLIDPLHRKRMGSAIWEFLWLVDKVTKEEYGRGYVFGGAPVAFERIGTDLGISRTAVGDAMRKLHAEGYIEMTRRRDGHRIVVLKSKKRRNSSRCETAGKSSSQRRDSQHQTTHNTASNTNICSYDPTEFRSSPRSHDMYKDITEDITMDRPAIAVSPSEIKAGPGYLFAEIESLPEDVRKELSERSIAEMASQPFSRNLLVNVGGCWVLPDKAGAVTMHKMVMRTIYERERQSYVERFGLAI